jgi:hypothetical protein
MDESRRAEALLRLLPPIRRARFWRLYALDGRRFLDLWMDGGSSLLGAKGTGLGTAVKAAVDVGLARPFPSIWERRLEKALLALYPGYRAVRFYESVEAALARLAEALGLSPRDEPSGLLLDPARRGPRRPAGSPPAAIVLRPFTEELNASLGPSLAAVAAAAPAAMPLLPCPRAFAPVVLLFRDREVAERAGSDLLPPLRLAAAAHALAELERFSKHYDEALWRRADRRLSQRFDRVGPYLYPRHGEAEHEAFFKAALGVGLLFSPIWELPSILPGDFDDGELAKPSSVP